MRQGSAVCDANEAVASVAYRLNEVIAIYPITPASAMGEHADEWAAQRQANVWGDVPQVVEMQSEGGAAGAVHGALQGGALATTFTASQGLLLMIPNLYKIAGELTPMVLHVAARTLATHALSIFCDHSDVMACRQIGMAMLSSSDVQQAQDFACIAQAATLESRIPVLHFFDGFRTSHEQVRTWTLSDDDLRFMIDREAVAAFRARALTPDHPVVRGTAQNPDTFFQAREAANPYYTAASAVFERVFARFAERTGRRYSAYEYFGHPEAERVVVVMGSALHTLRTAVEQLNAGGAKTGVLGVHLYRPFLVDAVVAALPKSVRKLAVLDRTKEPGAGGEPLYLDVVAALAEAHHGALPLIIGGRYGLSSKEFTPAMAKAVFDELDAPAPRRHFTVGIHDDVTGLSLDVKPDPGEDSRDAYEAVFFGLGSDGTVSANKNTIKIVAQESDQYVQGYFVYDSKKAGAVTVSHLRFSERPIAAPYLIERADFVGCHQYDFVQRIEVAERLKPGGTLLLNSPFGKDEVWATLPFELQNEIVRKRARLFVIDAYRSAEQAGLGRRINTVMQTAFFVLSPILPQGAALARLREAVAKSYGKKGVETERRNLAAIEAARQSVHEVGVPERADGRVRPPAFSSRAPDFVGRVTAAIYAGHGDALPVSAFPVDGTWPTATSRWEKRNLASEIPEWDEGLCIQCNKCVLLCPHAAIRAKVYPNDALAGAPDGFRHTTWKGTELKGQRYTLQVAPEDCTGCRLCVEVCPAKDKANPRRKALAMRPQRPVREAERERYDFFLSLPQVTRERVHLDVKNSQLVEPLFEYSGACAGCGETPYIKLLTQLFGDRLIVANATGCSSIYGANLPTTPYAVDANGRGPAWSNSLFEDNAEFGLGIRLAVDRLSDRAKRLLSQLPGVESALVEALLGAPDRSPRGIAQRRELVSRLMALLSSISGDAARELESLAEYLVPKSVWLVGGDGWAYDIGFGGLDHVLSLHHKINVLVLDTEVYSNTGGQQSKATPLAAAAKFATAGKDSPKKDLGLLAMSYGHIYVARVAIGAKDAQTVRALEEAEAHPGPSLVIAYSHCIAHGYDLSFGPHQQKLAVESGIWPVYRFDPARLERGETPLQLDSGPLKGNAREYMQNEARFRVVERLDKERYERLLSRAEADVTRRAELYEQLARIHLSHAVRDDGGSNGKEAQ